MVMPEILTQSRPKFVEAPHAPETIKVHPQSIVWIGGNKGSILDSHLRILTQGATGTVKRERKHKALVVHPGAVVEAELHRRVIKFTDSYQEAATEGLKEGKIKFIDSRHHMQRTYTVSPDNPSEKLPDGWGQVFWVEGDTFTLPLPLEPTRPLAPTPSFVYTASTGGGK